MRPVVDNISTATALSTPIWLPVVKDVSDLAAILLPILGCLWLIVQMYGFFKDHK